MKTIALTVEYDGTAYSGWQRQNNGPTVQQALEEAIAHFASPAHLIGAGRTDAGVHARGQVACFRTDSAIPGPRWALALNTRLPYDIRVAASWEAPADFHAQYHACGKHYRYSFFYRPTGSALLGRYSWHVSGPLQVQAMMEAAPYFEGTHDFSACMAAGAQTRSPVRTIYRSRITPCGDVLHFDVWGNGFLYNQVRIMAGTLYYVGLGKLQGRDIPALLQSCDRTRTGPTAPPQGLCLERVYYTPHPWDDLPEA